MNFTEAPKRSRSLKSTTSSSLLFHSTMTFVDGSNTSSFTARYLTNTNCSSSGTPLTSCFHPWYITAGVITAISCLLGIPTNISVIVKLSRHLHGSSMSQRLFFNLALSDLLSLLCLPVGGLIFLLGPRLAHGLCQFLFFLFFFCITSSINILVLISVQRYYQILHHSKWEKVNRTWQRFLLFTVWMLAALMALLVALSLTEGKDNLSCNQLIPPQLEATYIVFVVTCHLVLLFYYQLLARGLRKTQMSDDNKRRITKLFSRIIAVSLTVAFLPLVARVVYVIGRLTGSEEVLSVSKRLTFIECFYFFNHFLNPLLYFFASRTQMRDRAEKKTLLMALND